MAYSIQSAQNQKSKVKDPPAVAQTHIALDSTVADVVDEFALEILNNHLLGSNMESLALSFLEVLILADVCEETHDVMALLDEPGENDTGVETTRIGEENLLFSGHGDGYAC